MKALNAALSVAAAVGIVISQAGTALAKDEFSPAEQSALTAIVEKGMTEQRQPGVIVGIWIPGRGNWTAALGKADVDSGRPMDRADHVRIASITKSFVATAVLQLVDQGKLNLEDKLAAYVEGIPNGERITVRQLLGMTSGIYDFTSDEQFLKDFAANPLMPFGPQDVVAIVKRHQPEFAPGEKVSYCDTNYMFLGVILEKITGKPLAQVIKEQILTPLKLDQTSFPVTPAIPAPFARGYYAGDDGRGLKDYTSINPNVAWGAGAMISTLDDLHVWARALATGTLLKPKTQVERLQFGTMAATGISVGYGLGIAKFGDFIGHNGAILGYTTIMLYLPDADATFVVEGNQASNFSNQSAEILFALAKHLFPEHFAVQK